MKKTNSDKILALTEKWYRYVNLDHHKTKDCIWTIEISYAYGMAPRYKAYHHGYILDTWYSPECDTLEGAEDWLINKLIREIDKAKLHLEQIISLPEDSEERAWMDGSNKAPEILKELQK